MVLLIKENNMNLFHFIRLFKLGTSAFSLRIHPWPSLIFLDFPALELIVN